MELIGALLCDKWRLRRVLGVGGMSTVYEALHRNGNRVAIKMLNPEGALSSGVRRRFLREGYVANRVGHPGAVTVSDDVVSADGKVFLVMELLEGESLGARLRRMQGGLSVCEVLMVADQVLDILACAHERGIVHRDVKPDNVFLTCQGVLKLLDFGIASVRDLRELGVDVTRSGATLGTPAFMAPEQARGAPDEVDGRTDVWAVGAMMFTLLTRRHVHEGRNSNEVFVAAATQPARSIADVAADLDRGVVEVIDGALRFERAARWPDARAMQAAVRQQFARHGAHLPKPTAAAIGGEVFAWPRSASTEPELAPDADAARSRASSQSDWSWTRESSQADRRPWLRRRLGWAALASVLGTIAALLWQPEPQSLAAASLRSEAPPRAAATAVTAEAAGQAPTSGELWVEPHAPQPEPSPTLTNPPPAQHAGRRRVSHNKPASPADAQPTAAASPPPGVAPSHRLEPQDSILDRRD
jgi:serine/threonine-protein kinase